MDRDLRSNLIPVLLLNDDIASDTNTDSAELDVADYDGGIKFNVFAQTWVDGTYTVQIHASDTSGFTPGASTLLAVDELIPSSGTIVIAAALAKNAEIESLGALTIKRYVIVRIVSTNFSSSGATIVCTAEAVPEIKPRA